MKALTALDVDVMQDAAENDAIPHCSCQANVLKLVEEYYRLRNELDELKEAVEDGTARV